MPGCIWSGSFTRAQLARWYGSIPARYSCRNYAGAPDVAQKSALNYAAARVCLPGVRIVLGGCPKGFFLPVPFIGRVSGATDFAAVLVKRGQPAAKLCAGISGEAFVLEATALGLGSCWVSGSFRRSRCSPGAGQGETIAAVIPLGVPADREGPAGRRRKPLASLCKGDPAAWPFWAFKAAEAVRMAPSALNRQPWRFSFAGNTLRISGGRFGRLDDGIAILHAECAMSDTPHSWRTAKGLGGVLLSAEENDEPV